VWGLANRLKKEHEIRIICFSPSPNKLAGVSVINIDEKGSSLLRQWKLFKAVLRQARGADVVYVQGPLVVGLLSVTVAKILGKKVVVKFVGDEVWENERLKGDIRLGLEEFFKSRLSLVNRLKINLEKSTLSLVDTVVVPSDYLSGFLIDAFKLKPERIKVINNAVEIKKNAYKKKRHQLVTVGRLVPWKNIDLIIKAVKEARNKLPWRLVIVGEGPEERKLKSLTKRLKANEWVRFTGRRTREQTLKLIGESEKLILFSDYEGFSHTLIEGMLLGTNIIASDVEANRQVLDDYGSLVELGDLKSLTNAVNTGLANKGLDKSRFSWKTHVNPLKKVLGV
jgi:glycosyltransferase involved in cell wall biosynthesis